MRMAATLQPLLTFKKAEADDVLPWIDPHPNPSPNPNRSPNPDLSQVQREIDAWVDQLTAQVISP